MEITRRQFGGHLVKGAAIISLIPISGEIAGCGFVTAVEDFVPIGVAAIESVLAAVAANGIIVSPGAQIAANDAIAALKAIVAAVQEYQATTPAPVTAIQKLQAAFTAGIDQTEAFLSSLQLPGGNVLNLVTSLAQIVFSTILSFQSQLPVTPPASFKFNAALGAIHVSALPKKRSVRQFKKDWNADLDAAKKTGVNVPQVAYMKLSLLEHF